MKDILERLEEQRAQARLGGGRAAHRRAAQARASSPRASASGCSSTKGSFEGVRHVRAAPLRGTSACRTRRSAATASSRAYGTINGRAVFRLLQGLHGVRAARFRRRTRRKIIKVQDMALRMRAPIIGLFDAGRRAHPGGASAALGGYGEVFERNVRGLGRGAADLGDHGTLRRRRRLLPGGIDGLHLHGPRHELHVRHRPRRGEDRHQRDRHLPRNSAARGCTRRSPRSPTAPSTTTWRRCCRSAG